MKDKRRKKQIKRPEGRLFVLYFVPDGFVHSQMTLTQELNCYAVPVAGEPFLPRAAPAACTGLSTLDALRRQRLLHKSILCEI
jgi:hypothetical protein